MFNRKTLFVIGAGAGFDIDLPVGRKLAEDIARRTKITVDHGRLGSATQDEDLAFNFFERNDPKATEYANAFKLICNGILLSNSIDDFLNIHDASPEVVTVGKTAIVRSILYAERHSKIFVDPSNIYNKMDVGKIRDSWLVKFIQVLGPGLKVSDVERVFDNVSFINFNYDRCLEHFLCHALFLLYGINITKAAEIVSSATIIHPYGFVGPLQKVPYGGNDHMRMDCRGLSSAIKTYTERIEEASVIENMHAAIRAARCVVFLGFAYHKQNMELLKTKPSRKVTKEVFGTALHMSDSDVSDVVTELGSFFPDNDLGDNEEFLGVGVARPLIDMHANIHIENKLTCAELFDYYAKSLAG